MRSIRVGLLGCGVVGQGTLRLLREHAQSLERRLGAPIEVRRVVAKDQEKQRDPLIPKGLVSYDPSSVLEDPEIDIVVELMGGLEPAGTYVRTALERGKSVVTANKFLLAEQGHALFELAEERGADLYFEAAVCGGIPIIRVLREALVADSIVAVRGIVNGTSNYILSRMQAEKIDYAVALQSAQEAGYAEADPSLDVNGGDATHKLTILATLAFGAKLLPSHVSTEGIEEISALDMRMAERFGYAIKLLATARELPVGTLDLRVHPAFIPTSSVLASIHGALNAVFLEGAMLGPSLLSGYGAGAMPTAMSVVSDLVDVGRNTLRGSRGRVPQRTVRSDLLAHRQVQPAGMLVSPYYLRFGVHDRPNVIAKIASVLGAFDIAIHQMIQEARTSDPGSKMDVVVFTRPTRDDALRSALREIQMLSGIVETPRAIRVESA